MHAIILLASCHTLQAQPDLYHLENILIIVLVIIVCSKAFQLLARRPNVALR